MTISRQSRAMVEIMVASYVGLSISAVKKYRYQYAVL